MTFLKKLGSVLLKIGEIVTGFGPVLSGFVPSAVGPVAVVTSDLKNLGDIIATVEAVEAVGGAPLRLVVLDYLQIFGAANALEADIAKLATDAWQLIVRELSVLVDALNRLEELQLVEDFWIGPFPDDPFYGSASASTSSSESIP